MSVVKQMTTDVTFPSTISSGTVSIKVSKTSDVSSITEALSRLVSFRKHASCPETNSPSTVDVSTSKKVTSSAPSKHASRVTDTTTVGVSTSKKATTSALSSKHASSYDTKDVAVSTSKEMTTSTASLGNYHKCCGY